MTKHTFLRVAFLLITLPLLGQTDNRMTQEEVDLQQVFIEGTREKILERYDKAIPFFEQVLARDPDNAAAAFELAQVYAAEDDAEKALKYARHAAEKEPGNVWYQLFLADLYQNQNADDKAAEIFEKLVEANPDNDSFYFRWAYFLVRSNQVEKALKVYDRLEKKTGINEELTRRKHTLYLGMGDYKKAARELEKLIEAFPQKTAYRHLLAAFYEQIGDNARAKDVYRQILKMDPDDARATLALAGDGQGGSDVRYLRTLRPVFENPNVHIDVKISELLPYLQKVSETGDTALAQAGIQLTDILEKVHPDEAKAFSAAGDFYFYSNQKDRAIEKYKATLERDETVYLVWEQLLYAYADTRRFETLVKTAEEALDLFPNQAGLYYLNALGLLELGKPKDALRDLKQARIMAQRIPPLKYRILILTGKAWFALKDFDRSDKAFEEALQINADAPDALAAYAYCLASRDLEKAQKMAEKALRADPQNPEARHQIGWVFYQLKNYKKALDLLRPDPQNPYPDPLALEHYGDALFQTGQTEAAVKWWEKARDAGNSSPVLRKKIEAKAIVE
ncbi:MAG: tetratricopeptide repeat protein [Bacteroidetes bacterium]|nr:MAG: tetratricopeptide repeat protein [Bacteroidota bacterium]